MTELAIPPVPTPAWLQHDLRKVAAAATAGMVCGFVVNGVGSRLAMMLLAKLNPQVTGLTSDDGFRMGQFTLGNTAGLVLFATAVGVLGGLLFLCVRSLRFGPAWFRVASITIGPAVVVGSMLVHTDGIDFRVLEPVSLAIALFVLLPGLFALSVSWLTDRWTRPDAWPMETRRAWILGLPPLVLTGPAFMVVIGAFALRALHQSVPPVRGAVSRPYFAVAVRGIFVLVFLGALRDLATKVAALT